MKPTKGDYLIAEVKSEKGKQRLLVKVLSSDGKTFEGVKAKNSHLPGMRVTATFNTSDVMLNLGATPAPGKVYGVDTTMIYAGRKTHDLVGEINFFYKPKKEVMVDLMAAFTRLHKILDKAGLAFLLDEIVWEVIPYTGQKYAGMHITMKNPKDKDFPINRIQINPEILPASEYLYVLLHEVGHQLHARYLASKKLNAAWVKLFNTSIRVVNIKKDQSQRLHDLLISQEDPPSALRGQLEEDDQLAYKWVLRTIATNSGLSVRELDFLHEADMRDEITKVWPFRSISHKDLQPVISEYACKNYKETLAESFAFYFDKTKRKSLPASAAKLVEKSLAYAKAKTGN